MPANREPSRNKIVRIMDDPKIDQIKGPPYQHQSYPKVLYRPEWVRTQRVIPLLDDYGLPVYDAKGNPRTTFALDQKTRIVKDPEEHMDALDHGWYEYPDCFPDEKAGEGGQGGKSAPNTKPPYRREDPKVLRTADQQSRGKGAGTKTSQSGKQPASKSDNGYGLTA